MGNHRTNKSVISSSEAAELYEDRTLEGFFMDTCCQYEAHLRNLAGPGILDTVECWLGWLHSKAGHDISCQLGFSGLYAEGFGRAIGENAEQLHVSHASNVTSHGREPALVHHLPYVQRCHTMLYSHFVTSAGLVLAISLHMAGSLHYSTIFPMFKDAIQCPYPHFVTSAGLFQAASQGVALHGSAALE